MIDREVVASVIAVNDVGSQRQELDLRHIRHGRRCFLQFRGHRHEVRLVIRRNCIVADQDLNRVAIGGAARQRSEAEGVAALDRKASWRILHFAHRVECIGCLEIFAVKIEQSHPCRVSTIEVRMVKGSVLKIAEHRADVGGVVCPLKLGFLRLGKISAQIPFGENALCVREPVRVQNAANLLREANRVIGVCGTVGVGMPRIKIERHLMRGAVIDESFAVASVVGRKSLAVPANFEGGIHRLQRTRSFLIQ